MLPTDFDIFSVGELEHPVVRPEAGELAARRRATGRARSRGAGSAGRARRRGSRTPGPRCFSAIAEHSMCQPGRPSPQGEGHEVSSCGFVAFQRAKSRGSSFRSLGSWATMSSGFAPESEPYSGQARDAEVDVARPTRTRARARRAPRSARRSRGSSRSRAARRRAGRGRASSVSSKYHRVARAASSALGIALRARRVVDLVVHVGDVLDELHLVAPSARASASARGRRRTGARCRRGCAGRRSARRSTCGSAPAAAAAPPSRRVSEL